MSDESQNGLTRLLAGVREGDAAAFNQVFERVYAELQRLARVVRQGKAGETLNTTALVHEAYAKLSVGRLEVQNRLHFMRIAARAMRQILVTAAEHRLAAKRGGGEMRISLDEERHGGVIEPADLLHLEDALRRLEVMDPRQGLMVECRYFSGLTIPETAEALGVSVATVNREWLSARAWLAKELREH